MVRSCHFFMRSHRAALLTSPSQKLTLLQRFANSLRLTFLANPHLLNPVSSTSYKNIRGRAYSQRSVLLGEEGGADGF